MWPNAYSNNETPLAKQLFELYGKQKLFRDKELRGFIDSLDFKVNDKRVYWELLPAQTDVCLINLEVPLAPGDTVEISTPFRVKIPKGVTSRLGHIGESYQISQWYPKPAVYDREGWHPISYLDQGEFFSEFGSFDVHITLPANYVVGASGNLQTPSEIEMLDTLSAHSLWITTINSAETDFPVSSKQLKTINYIAEKVHDFAWFADKRFYVKKGKITLPQSGKEVVTMVLFTDEQYNLWKDALSYVENAIFWLSNKIGDYPYKSITAVQGALTAGSGMEYPGITVIGMADDAYSLDQVITHEICHNWFYGALGSDERTYPFLDESITSAYTDRYLSDKYYSNKPIQRMYEVEWLVQARNNLEQPLNLLSTDYTELNYLLMLYNKGSNAFNYLRAYLGDNQFDSAMQEYFYKWKFRHPQPQDLRKIVENQTGKDLTWFFTDLLGTTKRLDYKVVGIENQKVLIQNRGELVSPLLITGMKSDSIIFEKWLDGFEGEKWIDLPSDDCSKIVIDPRQVTPEIYRTNNSIKKMGLFPKVAPINTKLFFSANDPAKHTLTYIPAIFWLRENGFMLGMAFHNGLILPKQLQCFIMPFYAFGNRSLAGFGRIAYNITPYDNFIRMATISLEAKQFGAPEKQNYHKLKTGLELNFRNKKIVNDLNHKLIIDYIAASNLSQIKLFEKAKTNSYLQLKYVLEKSSLVNPYNLLVFLESGETYRKASIEFNYRLSYWRKNSGLDVRFFAGKMLRSHLKTPYYSFSASGRSGREQYLYQNVFPNRFSPFPQTFSSRQMTLSEGGIVSYINNSLGYSQWLLSLSLTTNLPGKASILPIKPFINMLLNDHGVSELYNSQLFCEAGVKVGLWDFFEIYIPLLVTKNIEFASDLFKNRIRFVFSLDSFKTYIQGKSR